MQTETERRTGVDRDGETHSPRQRQRDLQEQTETERRTGVDRDRETFRQRQRDQVEDKRPSDK